MLHQKILGLCGRAYSGKSTLSNRLEERMGFVRFSTAKPLKDVLLALGLTKEQLYGDQQQKEEPDHRLLGGKTPRDAMITLGTEWGRELIHTNIWTDALEASIKRSGCEFAVVDDIRFPNEVEMIRKNGGLVLAIHRPGMPEVAAGHASESMDFEEHAIPIINNDRTVDALYAAALLKIGKHFYP